MTQLGLTKICSTWICSKYAQQSVSTNSSSTNIRGSRDETFTVNTRKIFRPFSEIASFVKWLLMASLWCVMACYPMDMMDPMNTIDPLCNIKPSFGCTQVELPSQMHSLDGHVEVCSMWSSIRQYCPTLPAIVKFLCTSNHLTPAKGRSLVNLSHIQTRLCGLFQISSNGMLHRDRRFQQVLSN